MAFIRNKISLLILALILVLFSDCKKSDKNEVDNESQSVVDCSIAGQEFSALVSSVCYAAFNTQGLSPNVTLTNISACDKLIFDTLKSDGRHYRLNASQYCSFPDGKTRSGLLTVRTPNDTLRLGSKITIWSSGYSCGDLILFCDSITATIVAVNSDNVLYDLRIMNGKVQIGTGNIKCDVNGQLQNYNKNNNQYSILTGVINGINRGGGNFSSAIYRTGIKKFRNCGYISEGFMELTPEGFKARTVDFGDGTCDDLASFRVNENTVAFKLK
ncbi:MAG: hypothetical protein JNL60_03440 [Bacteroidia bacterium]|nr:hypothetical protein [Bacteroidia bacterium]